jgi:hypothetical protein
MGDLSQLLQLGRQGFLQQLQQFLAPHPSMLWMTEVQSGNLSKAARTLDAAASAEQVCEQNGRYRLLVCSLFFCAPAVPADSTINAPLINVRQMVQASC